MSDDDVHKNKKHDGHLDELIEKANDGDEVVLSKGGAPVAKLVALQLKLPSEPLPPRTLGDFRGQFWIADDFDAPLSDELWGFDKDGL